MNKTQITLIITGFIILALMATNPSIEDHREGVKKIYKEKLEKINKQENGNLGAQIGTGIASLIGDGFIDKIVSRDNYLLFSLTKVSLGDKSKNIGVGILGNVFIKDYDDIKESLSGNDSEKKDNDLIIIDQNKWIGIYDNYVSRIQDEDKSCDCWLRPGGCELEIKETNNKLFVYLRGSGLIGNSSYTTDWKYDVDEINSDFLIFTRNNDGDEIRGKIYKANQKYFVTYLTDNWKLDPNSKDFELVKKN